MDKCLTDDYILNNFLDWTDIFILRKRFLNKKKKKKEMKIRKDFKYNLLQILIKTAIKKTN